MTIRKRIKNLIKIEEALQTVYTCAFIGKIVIHFSIYNITINSQCNIQ